MYTTALYCEVDNILIVSSCVMTLKSLQNIFPIIMIVPLYKKHIGPLSQKWDKSSRFGQRKGFVSIPLRLKSKMEWMQPCLWRPDLDTNFRLLLFEISQWSSHSGSKERRYLTWIPVYYIRRCVLSGIKLRSNKIRNALVLRWRRDNSETNFFPFYQPPAPASRSTLQECRKSVSEYSYIRNRLAQEDTK